jgi:hypothetical protein
LLCCQVKLEEKEMNEREIKLAAEMLMHSVFASEQEVKNIKIWEELIPILRMFFLQEVLDEAIKRIIKGKEEEK